jgi:hypothetical protein
VTLPEQLGIFTVYGPDSVPGRTGWSMAAGGMWMSGVFASRDACLLVAGMVLADYGAAQNLVIQLRDRYNRADPPVDISVGHILFVTGALADEDEEDEL